MNKKMFIICVVFVLISSCKHYGSGKEDLKNSGQSLKEQVKGALDTTKDGLKEGVIGGLRNLGLGAAGQEIQADGQPAPEVHADEQNPEVQQADGVQEGQQVEGQQVQEVQVNEQPGEQPNVQAQVLVEDPKIKEIENKIKALKDKIEKADPKKTSLGTYSTYEEEVKKISKELKDLKDKKTSEDELKQLEESLKTKKDARKKELEEFKNKFEDFKSQVGAANGVTEGDRVGKQGNIGLQAFQQAQALGLNVNIAKNDGTNSNELANQVIDGALKKIEEELAANNIKKE
ncbi:hypothetical protein [Borreliella lusitaniae]|uniref:hypothetical protein n=1 Tax=Borreliella lusitaniae TaxID=100177 RepID=UPI003AB2623A